MQLLYALFSGTKTSRTSVNINKMTLKQYIKEIAKHLKKGQSFTVEVYVYPWMNEGKWVIEVDNSIAERRNGNKITFTLEKS